MQPGNVVKFVPKKVKSEIHFKFYYDAKCLGPAFRRTALLVLVVLLD
jgi:hypothetical protein